MHRRDLLIAGITIVSGLHTTLSPAHTLYHQWVVYRRKHLIIGSHREDLKTYLLAKKVDSILQEKLPPANSRVARAPTAGRIASLMATEQMHVALVKNTQAIHLANGTEEFKPYGKIALNTLFLFSQYCLVCRRDIPEKHGWLITQALTGSTLDENSQVKPPLPWHNGSLLFIRGQPLPEDT